MFTDSGRECCRLLIPLDTIPFHQINSEGLKLTQNNGIQARFFRTAFGTIELIAIQVEACATEGRNLFYKGRSFLRKFHLPGS